MKAIKSFLVGFLVIVIAMLMALLLIISVGTVFGQSGIEGYKPTPTSTEVSTATPTDTEVPTSTLTSTNTITPTSTSTIENTPTVTSTVTPTAFLTNPPKPSATFTKPNTLPPPEYKETPSILLPTTGADKTLDWICIIVFCMVIAIICALVVVSYMRDKK